MGGVELGPQCALILTLVCGDRRQGDAARAHIIHAQTRHEIEAAFHAGKALEQSFVLAQIVAEGEAFGGVAADIETELEDLCDALGTIGLDGVLLARGFDAAGEPEGAEPYLPG